MTDRDFLSRWSQRKVEGRRQKTKARFRAFAPIDEPPDDAPKEPEFVMEPARGEVAAWQPEDGAEEGQQEPCAPEIVEDPATSMQETDEAAAPPAEADLPDVDSLDYESDYRGFMAEGVSEDLRNRALRRLWRSNPVLANVDGLNDYDEDFTDAATVVAGLKSAYKAIGGYGDALAGESDAEIAGEGGDDAETVVETVEEDAPTDSGREDAATESGDEDGASASGPVRSAESDDVLNVDEKEEEHRG